VIITDLREIKTVLDMDPSNTAQDAKLLLYAEWATNIINTYLGRAANGIDYKSRTQYYLGTGTQKLLLRNRPVYPSPSGSYSALAVYVDQGGYFGTASGAFDSTTLLTYGTDYTLQIDQDDGSSRSGILIRVSNYWPKPTVRQQGLLSPFIGPDTGSIKVIYTAGWTLDTLPAAFRMAANMVISQLNLLFPLGMWLTGESYEERSVSYTPLYWWNLLDGILGPYRNWKF